MDWVDLLFNIIHLFLSALGVLVGVLGWRRGIDAGRCYCCDRSWHVLVLLISCEGASSTEHDKRAGQALFLWVDCLLFLYPPVTDFE